MNISKKYFSIRDLENLSGIKAHTIRIWEKRYLLLSPERTETNIRTYSLDSLQKLLNITLLYNNGYKISKIAKIQETQIPTMVNEIIAKNSEKHHAVNAFKLAMVNFDTAQFYNTYNSLVAERSFKEMFNDVLVPLMNELGLLWQVKAISTAHEHFITSLIKQKIYIHTEKFQKLQPTREEEVFVLYLPEGEIHEVGLLFLNYEIVSKGFRSIYLGQANSLESLKELLGYYSKVHFVSYFTVSPQNDEIEKYLRDFNLSLYRPGCKLSILGYQTQRMPKKPAYDYVKAYESIAHFSSILEA
jgi:MerR family transcriptional regulator, light-induced transcriptional regulator